MNRLIIKVLNKLNLLKFLNINVSIYLNKRKFVIPIIGKMGTTNLTVSEPWMIDVLIVILEKYNGKFFDIGVNVGQTLLKLKCVNNKIDYIGFEPNPSCVFYTRKLIQSNNFRNCTIIPVGISNSTGIGMLNFQSNSLTDSGASMISGFRPGQIVDHTDYIPLFNVNQIEEAVSLDEFSVLKIDVEGAELEVIAGFYELINKFQPIILLEILPIYHAGNQFRLERQKEVIKIIWDLNYLIFRIIKKNDAFIGFHEIGNIDIHSNLNDCDYVLIPKKRKAEFSNQIVTIY